MSDTPKERTVPTILMMTPDQARECVEQIKDHVGEIRKLVLDLHEREGWKALGYDSWRECVVAEFEQSQSRLYQLLDAAKVERNISNMLEKQPPLTKRVVDQLKNLPPDKQREVWSKAVKTAPNSKVTAAHVETVKSWTAPGSSGQTGDINTAMFGYSGLSLEVTEEEKIVKRFKAFVANLSKEKNISKAQIKSYISGHLGPQPVLGKPKPANGCRFISREIVSIIKSFSPDDLWFIPALDAIQEAIDFTRTKHSACDVRTQEAA